MILSEFIPNHQLGKSEISHCVEQTWNNLLYRTGESTPRLRTLAITFIQVSRLLKYFICYTSAAKRLLQLFESTEKHIQLNRTTILNMPGWPDLLSIFIDDWEWILPEGIIYTVVALWSELHCELALSNICGFLLTRMEILSLTVTLLWDFLISICQIFSDTI